MIFCQCFKKNKTRNKIKFLLIHLMKFKMSSDKKTEITVEATVNSPAEKVWKLWTDPGHITGWCHASDDWHAPYAENDIRTGGKFKTTMSAKDGSTSFDFEGVYTNVEKYKLIEYTLLDDRKVKVTFSGNGNETKITETFEAENIYPHEMQKQGWQAILNNFKSYAESAE